mmetsp:Transcript_15205/g.26524  ORF Transcript_15205/g.26524 Transcript_15205/m.26524 type:complete len:283 (+) Transcript_15205:220-1068(+)
MTTGLYAVRSELYEMYCRGSHRFHPLAFLLVERVLSNLTVVAPKLVGRMAKRRKERSGIICATITDPAFFGIGTRVARELYDWLPAPNRRRRLLANARLELLKASSLRHAQELVFHPFRRVRGKLLHPALEQAQRLLRLGPLPVVDLVGLLLREGPHAAAKLLHGVLLIDRAVGVLGGPWRHQDWRGEGKGRSSVRRRRRRGDVRVARPRRPRRVLHRLRPRQPHRRVARVRLRGNLDDLLDCGEHGEHRGALLVAHVQLAQREVLVEHARVLAPVAEPRVD